MPYATAVTPSPGTSCIAKTSAWSSHVTQCLFSKCSSCGFEVPRKSCCFFMALVIFLDRTVILWPGVCDEMQEKGRIALGFDKETRCPERKWNLSGSLSDFCSPLSVTGHKWIAAQVRLVIQKSRAVWSATQQETLLISYPAFKGILPFFGNGTCSNFHPSDMVDTICVSSSSWHCSTLYTCFTGPWSTENNCCSSVIAV